MGIFILSVQKRHSYIHKKEAKLNVFRPLDDSAESVPCVAL